MGYFIRNVAGTLTAALARVKNVTATDPHGHLAIGTHIEGEAYVDSQTSEASNVTIALYDGTSIRAMRTNMAGTLLASAARTGTASSSTQTNYNAKGVYVMINATAIANTPSVVPTVEIQNPITSGWVAILTGAAITTAAPTSVLLTVYPGAAAVANLTADTPLGLTWRVTMTHATGSPDSLTYSVAFALIN